MYNQEKIIPYGKKEEKVKVVEEMFNNIAPNYDKLNHLMSFDIDKGWRRKAISRLMPYPHDQILDIATGTGDFAILAAKMLRPEKITAVDISEGMMNVGRLKAKEEGVSDTIDFKKEDCTNMTFADNTFDAVISAFGIRNFQDLDKGLAEMCRVLKKGGHLSIVELATPVKFPMRQLFKIYSHIVLPAYGKIVSHDKSAYEYLPATIEAFPQGEQMMDILLKAGFAKAGFKRLTCGICTMFVAEK
jgi:demethylmenaquinone methyltransferase/2-methoxy-6-polyprenyl-1,4-benzoquinol methylase